MSRTLTRNQYATFAMFGMVLALAGCSGDSTSETPAVDQWCGASAFYRIEILDVWGRPLPEASITSDRPELPTLLGATPVTHTASATDLVPAEVTLSWDGTTAVSGLTATATGGALTAVSFDFGGVEGHRCYVYTVYLGLDHPFYARSGRAPKAGNKATLLMDGQEYWEAVYADLVATETTARVHQSTWWWQSNFELHRPDDHDTLSQEARWDHTMLALLEKRTQPVRLLVARFAEATAAGLAYLNTDPELRVHGTDPDDGFEVMLQTNPTPSPIEGVFEPTPVPVDFAARVRRNPAFADRSFDPDQGVLAAALEAFDGASYHQKCLTIGDNIAYVSGQNVKSTDWDTSEHLVFDHRRMVFDATLEERAAVKARQALPDKGPRKDYGFRIEGPAAQDVDDVLRARWDLGMGEGAMFEGDATAYDLLDPGSAVGPTTVQVIATMPDPIAERSILESQVKAVQQAKDFIYIEDQYFRAPVLDEHIAAAMDANPNLYLVVVTKAVTLTDGGKKWTVLSDETFRRFGDRYLLLWLKAFDREGSELYFQPLDVHSKIMFVDDVYVTTGSANKNNRGLLYEGELNVAVHSQAFVSDARRRVLANLVGPDYAGSIGGATGAELTALLRTLATENAAFEAAVLADPAHPGAPNGFVYPLEITPEYLLEVGPDLF